MSRHKIQTSVYLTPQQVAGLRARSKLTSETGAAIIRRAVDRELVPAPAHPLDVLAKLAPEFFERLSPAESVVIARMWGLA
jgi:hypothetical protein